MWTSFTQGLFFYDPQTLAFAHDPTQLLATVLLAAVQLVTHRIFDLAQPIYNFPQLLALPLSAFAPAPASGLSGLAGLAGLAPPGVTTTPIPPAAAPQPTVAPAAAVPAASPPPAAAAAPAAAPAATAPPPSPVPPPAGGVTGLVFPYVVGGPGIGSGPGISSRAVAKKAAPAPAAAAVPTEAAAVREQRRARRRRRTRLRGHGDEFMAMNVLDVEVEPGPAGFADAAGLTTLPGKAFGNGPAAPMLPESWSWLGDRKTDWPQRPQSSTATSAATTSAAAPVVE